MTQVETEAIAQGMLQITDEFQKQTGIADEVVDRIIEHSTDGCVCKDCLEDFSIDQWLELIGESLTTAERED